jgi:hypothetical protein
MAEARERKNQDLLLARLGGYPDGPVAFASSISCKICRRSRVFHHVDQHFGRTDRH